MKKKKESLKFLYLILLGLLVFQLVMPIVLAQDIFDGGASFDNNDNPIINNIREFFQKWQSGNLDTYFIKYILWAIISMIIYSILSTIPGTKKFFNGNETSMFGLILSAIMGFLAMAYITPDEIFVIMQSWSAMGFSIGIVLPFVIMMYWTMMLAEEDNQSTTLYQVMKQSVAQLLWFSFSIYLFYRLFTIPDGASTLYFLTLIIMIIISLIIAAKIKTVFNQIAIRLTNEVINRARRRGRAGVNRQKDLAEEAAILGGAEITPDGVGVPRR